MGGVTRVGLTFMGALVALEGSSIASAHTEACHAAQRQPYQIW